MAMACHGIGRDIPLHDDDQKRRIGEMGGLSYGLY